MTRNLIRLFYKNQNGKFMKEKKNYMTQNCKKILDLPLKKEWYDMIESGVKTEEYREIKPYWCKRLLDGYEDMCTSYKPFTHVRFHCGYTNRTMLREIESMRLGYGKPEWGAPKGTRVFIIKLRKVKQ